VKHSRRSAPADRQVDEGRDGDEDTLNAVLAHL